MKILVAGDYIPRNRVESILKKKDFSSIFADIRSLNDKVDYSIVNLECPIVLGDASPIEKSGPNLKCTSNDIDAIKWAGFNCVTLANNHILDFGSVGVENTIKTLQEKNIDFVGAGDNYNQASKILYKEFSSGKLAIINCCEHEFCIATDSSAGANPINPIKQYYAIREAKTKADYVLVIVHGGHEHFQLPSIRMVDTYRFFIDAGADMVVNHHQHCFSGYEIYKNKPIIYGLGNLCIDTPSNQSEKWTEGYAVTIDFEKKHDSFEIHPYIQCASEATIKLLSTDAFDEKLRKINNVITDTSKLKCETDRYYRSCVGSSSWLFEPIRIGLYFILRYKGLLPSFVSKKKKISAANMLLCESHYDKMKWWLEH